MIELDLRTPLFKMIPLKIVCVFVFISIERSVHCMSDTKYETKLIELKNRIGKFLEEMN